MSKLVVSRREFLRYIATGSAMLTLAACAPKSEQPAGGDKQQPAQASGGRIALQQWYHEYGEKGCQEAVYRIADEYNKMQDKVEVKVTWTPGNYDDKLSSAMAAGTGPDVYESGLNLSKVRANQVVPLDELFTDEIKADFDQKDLTLNSIDGKIYGVRMIIDTGLLYCRKSIFDKAGLKPPTTWEELFDAAKKLTEGRQKGLFLGNDGGIGALQDVGAWAAGVTYVDENKELKFNVPALAEVFEKVRDLNQSGSLLVGSPTDWWDPSAFTQGLSAMQWTGLWAMPGIREKIQEDFYVNLFPPVKTSGGEGTYSTFWGGWVEFVNGQSKHIPEAMAFIKWQWIENKDWQNEWASAYGFHVPSRKSAAAANDKLKEGNPKIAVDGLYKYGRNNGPYWNGAMGQAVTDAFSNIVKNNAPAKEAIQAAFDKCQKELEALLKG